MNELNSCFQNWKYRNFFPHFTRFSQISRSLWNSAWVQWFPNIPTGSKHLLKSCSAWKTWILSSKKNRPELGRNLWKKNILNFFRLLCHFCELEFIYLAQVHRACAFKCPTVTLWVFWQMLKWIATAFSKLCPRYTNKSTFTHRAKWLTLLVLKSWRVGVELSSVKCFILTQ